MSLSIKDCKKAMCGGDSHSMSIHTSLNITGYPCTSDTESGQRKAVVKVNNEAGGLTR